MKTLAPPIPFAGSQHHEVLTSVPSSTTKTRGIGRCFRFFVPPEEFLQQIRERRAGKTTAPGAAV